ncbi:2576_t:CDS:2 [Entrophospora sp. SA101]|nr:1167_t:CDS:2 [Entrophospora sp. SA101]CAJ0631871.1 3837_t:CDS:2 [Entrophospora sp. SA101]CAJ0766287.1 2576_t:CDS:2 [Entrophospora sp. SA101]CAJ0831032.1 17784_t:CDS:2 [Entrophospora sp. SA101]CAJ0840504.1 11938_t:CDS:2 [Entrophospora sp. SA101]
MSAIITLTCLVHLKTLVNSPTFSIQINKKETIEKLKETIKENNAPDFDKFTAKNLKLWKIDIADDPRHYFTEYYLGEIYDHRKEISTTGHVEDYWTDTPPKGNIHIIVEPPVQVIFIPVHGAPVVKIKPHNIEFKEMVGCEQTELKPVLYGLPDYDLYMYLDDTGLLKDLPRNALATCLLYGRKMDQVPGVRGHVVLYDSYKQLTLDDFRFILSTAQNLN